MGIPRILQTTTKLLTDHSPAVLTALGVLGTVSTAILTARTTVDAVRLVDADPDLTPKEAVKLTWKLYIPPLSVAAVTVSAIILANRIGTRRAAALAAAYSLSEHAFEEYRDKVKEKFGAKKAQEVRDEVAQDRVNRNPPKPEVMIVGANKILCYDSYSSRYFESTMETIKGAQNDTNYQIMNHDSCSLNEFYDRIGLGHIKFGFDVGWSSAMDKLEISFSTVISEDGRPTLVIDYNVEPMRKYQDAFQ